MSMLNTYNTKLQALEKLQKELEALEQNSALREERDFRDKLKTLMNEYSMSSAATLEVLGYTSAPQENTAKRTRKKSVYVNPHTHERVAGNRRNPIISAWMQQYGEDTVRGWQE